MYTQITIRCNTAVYHLTRCAFYALLITRIHVAFSNSVYSYNKKLKISLLIIVASCFTFAMIGDLGINGISGFYYDDTPGFASCQPIFKLYGIVLSGLIDTILSIVLLLLFIKPLLKLNEIQSNWAQDDAPEIPRISKSYATAPRKQSHDVPRPTIKPIKINAKQINEKPFRSIAGIRIIAPPNDETVATEMVITPPPITPIPTTPITPITPIEPSMPATYELAELQEQTTNTLTPYAHIVYDMKALQNGSSDIDVITRTGTMSETKSNESSDTMRNNETIKEEKLPQSPIKQQRSRSRSNLEKRDEALDELTIRYALLVIIAIVSSAIFHGLTIACHWTTDLAPIDDVINVWCIVLLNKVNGNVYKRLCCSCHRLMKMCCRMS